MKTLDLAELPADPSATDGRKFIGVTDGELRDACDEYSRRMKEAKDPHEAFGLRREFIVEVAKEVSERNLMWIKEHIDKNRPKDLLKHLHEAPQDKLMWNLKLLRRHGFKQVELVVWVAADMFLAEWVEKFGRDARGRVMAEFELGK